MNHTLKALTSIALLVGTAQLAHAHAGFKDSITEGTVATWNAVKITHGCNTNVGGEGNGVPHKDVIAFSAVFPNSATFGDVIMRGSKGGAVVAAVLNTDGTTKTPAVPGFTTGMEDTLTDLSAHLIQAGTTSSGVPLTMGLGLVNTGGTIFANNIPVVNRATGAIRGWQSWSGSSPFNGPALLETSKTSTGADISETGLAPFGIGAFQFKPDSCAKTLKIRVAVADWCGKGAASYADPGRVDVWIGSMTTKFNDPATMPNANANPIFWPTITVNRDLLRNPLPGTKAFNPDKGVVVDRSVVGWTTGAKDASGNAVTSAKIACDQTTDYDTVYIEPSNADIDNYLPISPAKYPNGSNGALYWPTPAK